MPAELGKPIRSKPGGEAQIVVWRAGEETAKGIVLAGTANARWREDRQILRMLEELRLQVGQLREQVETLGRVSVEQNEKPDNPTRRQPSSGSTASGTWSDGAAPREYYQDYGHYYRFQRPPARSFRDYSLRQPPARYYSYYPYAAPPFGYYRDEGRTYYYLAPEGPRFGIRVGPYWFEY